MTDPFYNPVVPAYVAPTQVHDFNVFDVGDEDPFQAVRDLHVKGVPDIFWTRNNGGHWIASRADTISAILADSEHASASRPFVPDFANLAEPIFVPLLLDPPEHGVYRKMIAPLFGPKRIAALEGQLRERVDQLINDILAQRHCEFMEAFAAQFPVLTFMALLDLPPSDRSRLRALAHGITKPDPDQHRDVPLSNLMSYIRAVIEDRRAKPGEDVISELLATTFAGPNANIDDLVNLTTTVLIGGLDTVTAALGYLTWHLAGDEPLRRRLHAEPNMIGATVEETLRRYPTATPGRYLLADWTLSGAEMRAGDHVNWTPAMFNLDDRVHKDPMKFDIDRERRPYATFGVGPHFCIGVFLAKLEIKIFLEHWTRRVPNFAIKSGSPIRHRIGVTTSLEELHLEIR